MIELSVVPLQSGQFRVTFSRVDSLNTRRREKFVDTMEEGIALIKLWSKEL